MAVTFPQANEWKIVSYVQLVWFIIVLLWCGLITLVYFRRPQHKKAMFTFVGFFTVFCLLKVVGGALGVVTVSSFTTGKYIGTYICDSTALGLLTRAIFPFVETMLKNERNEKLSYKLLDSIPTRGALGRLNLHPFAILTLVVLVAVILSIVGSSQLASESLDSTSNIGVYFKVSGLLFLGAAIIILGILGWIFATKPRFHAAVFLLLASAIFLIIRCIYSVLSAFKGISFIHPSQYALLYGDFKYYTFLAFMMEAFVSVLYLITFHWFLINDGFDLMEFTH